MFIFTSAQLMQLLNAARNGAYGDGFEDGYAAFTADCASDIRRKRDFAGDTIDAEFVVVDPACVCGQPNCSYDPDVGCTWTAR